MKFKQVVSFFQLDIQHLDKDETLVVLDIDETILYYDTITNTWWEDTFNDFYKQTRDYDVADTLTTQLWKTTIDHNKPHHTDKNGLQYLLRNYNCVFITARTPDLMDHTRYEFDVLGIPYNNVYYSGDRNKSDVLLPLLTDNIKHVVFVDDRVYNCTDVKDALTNVTTHIFQFCM